jgi:hypothetical protein
MMRSPRIALACVAVLASMASVLSLLVPAVAAAVEGTPLGIENFTLRTTAATIKQPAGQSGFGDFELINEPYAFTQAGGRPWGLTTTGELSNEEFIGGNGGEEHRIVPTRDPRDIVVGLPPGLLGNPQAVPQCSLTFVLSHQGNEKCPASTQVGVYHLWIVGGNQSVGPIVNVTPSRGQSAEFALENKLAIDTPLLTAHLVRTAQGEYGFTVVSSSIPNVSLYRFELTFWGVPADPSHDLLRGAYCVSQSPGAPLEPCDGGGEHAGVAPVAFLALPTGCASGPETATMRADSWEEPGSVNEGRYTGWAEKTTTMPAVTGCGGLNFDPTVEWLPETKLADEPVGGDVRLQVPQSESPETTATPHLKEAVVTLPEGMSVNAGIVDGIQACNEKGPEGINFEGPESEEVGPSGELQLASGHCPEASAVGTAEAITPLLPEPVKGHVYLARPACGNPTPCNEHDAADGNLYQLYLELGGQGDLADTGINIKARGRVLANPATGQLTSVFEDNPQAPFSELRIHLNGGVRAPLANPASCGTATTTARLRPWSAPGVFEGLSIAGTPDATPSSFFNVEGCATPPGLTPGFSAGTVSPQAGQFSPFTMNLTRRDREQYFKGIQIHTPPGLLGMLSSVQLCEEPLANNGHCPESSRIGITRVASGAGTHPFEISGNVYLTKAYRGAPFGLSIVTNAVAGPFNLGLVVVRARINVDPVTSALTVTTDETGPYAVPQILDGVPLRLKQITVNIDRPGFMFNPTNCKAQQVTATVSGSQNAVANVSSPFAAAGCRSLAFQPQFTVTTNGHTSKVNGASLDAKVAYPPGSVGTQASIAYVKVELPKQLPSRLTTLQKACVVATFEANPANCSAASVIGIVRASTPVLPVPLSGPVYFVSHGGEAFPSLIAVLQGDGVRVDLTGTTFIDKHGITSSTFKTVPDVPVSSFELYLPQGPDSALAANTNLCSVTTTRTVRRRVTRHVHGHTVHKTLTAHVSTPATLSMPTEFIAQNGAVLRQSTQIKVTGCAKAAKTSAHPHAKHANRRRR